MASARSRFRAAAHQGAARRAVTEYLDGWYNSHRRHSALGYLSLVAFEARLASAA